MTELTSSSSEISRPIDAAGQTADVPFLNHAQSGRSTGESSHQASVEVLSSIDDIEATEARIAEQTGLRGQELTDTTDEFLVSRAEQAVDNDESQTEEYIETALIEGALEAINERPPASKNPIIQLEVDGYDEQVTAEVQRLQATQVTLPGGSSAAEVVALALPSAEGPVKKPTISDELDTAIQYYVLGASKKYVAENSSIDPAELTAHIKRLPEDEREFLKAMRRKSLANLSPSSAPDAIDATPAAFNKPHSEIVLSSAFVYGLQEDTDLKQVHIDTWFKGLSKDEQAYYTEARQENMLHQESITTTEALVERNLQSTGPELLKARLPEALAQRIGSEYAIGLRQLGNDEVGDAQEQLMNDAGVDVSNLGLVQSFNVLEHDHDPDTIKGTVIRGYYGVKGGGKFVIAIPLGEDLAEPYVAYDRIPDMQRPLGSGDNPDNMAVNPKYLAGFIDAEGIFHTNKNFMISDQAEIVAGPQPDTLGAVPSVEIANPYERLSNEQLVVVRDNIADSIIEGIKKYDTTEITRASINLAAIQREFEARFADQRPAHARGENDGAITYVTEPDPNIVLKIVDRLQTIDGAPYIAKSLYGVVKIPESSEAGMEARLQGIEQMTLFSGISKEIRRRTGSEFSPFNNPYSIMKNEDLAKIVERLKETIQTLTTQGKDTTDFRDKMMLVGKVIQSRR